MFKNKRGFTLIELIIVMAIIAILVLLAAPKFMDYIRDAKLTQIKNDTRVVEDLILTMKANNIIEDINDTNIITKKINNKGISKENTELSNIDQGRGYQIDSNFIKKQTNSKLDPNSFYYNNEKDQVFYYYNKNKSIDTDNNKVIDEDKKERYNKALEKYHIYTKEDNNIIIKGLKLDNPEHIDNIDDIIDLELMGGKIIKIEDGAFSHNLLSGEFPKLHHLEVIGLQAFYNSDFTKGLEHLHNIKVIKEGAFFNSSFKYEFPQLDNLEIIGGDAFNNSNFTGEFPQLDNLQKIGEYAFDDPSFNIPDYYNGWDGINEWIKE